MAVWSVYFTDTSDPGPTIGDGRPYTAAEWRTLEKYLWAQGNADRGVLKGALNSCQVTIQGVNSLQVDTGLIMCNGGIVVMEAAELIAPASAAPGTTRKDSVICELDLDGSGVGQNKVRVTYKQGTAGAFPAMTQNAATVWQIELYRYTIDDGGTITGLTDMRQYLRVASEMDHGQLSGLLDDDHTQYMDVAGVRHTKAVHDALLINADLVDGFHAADLITGVALGFVGCTVLWGGTLGGSDGHRPVSGGAHEDWHLANGETVNGVVTLDSRNRVPIGAGSTYAVNDSGGAATINIAHTHAAGTLANSNESAHTHAKGTLANANESTHTHIIGAEDVTSESNHVHGAWSIVDAGTGGELAWSSHDSLPAGTHDHHLFARPTQAGSAHTHTIAGSTAAGSAHTHTVSGSTASGLGAAQSVLNPYRAWYFITYVGT